MAFTEFKKKMLRAARTLPLKPGDIYITKFSPNGQNVLYQTILGGSSVDRGYALSVDAAGNATVAGIATSFDYPLLNPIQASHAGGIYDDELLIVYRLKQLL